MTLAIAPRIFSLAVHLPQLVRLRTLEAARRRTMRVFADQIVTLQNAVNGPHRQWQLFFFVQQHPQLFRAPTRLLAQGHNPLFRPRCGAARAAMRPSAALGYLRQAAGLPVALPPEITSRPRNPKLTAQGRHPFPPADRSNHKLHPLLVHIHPFPRHRLRPPWPETLTAM